MESVTALSTRAEIFRRTELAHQIQRLGVLITTSRLPLPVGALAPIIEFTLATAGDVDVVAEAIGESPKQHKTTYWVDLETAELRVRWSTTVAEGDDGFGFSRPADGDDPQPVAGREPTHTGAVTESGLVDETAAEAVHMRLVDGTAYCGAGGPGSFVWREVTCADCISKGRS